MQCRDSLTKPFMDIWRAVESTNRHMFELRFSDQHARLMVKVY